VTDVYRRRIRVVEREGAAFGALEDDAHHVRATIRHDRAQVTAASGEAVRLPWVTCPGSAAGIASLVGSPLAAVIRSGHDAYRPELHCTHMFDLAQLTVAQAARGTGARQYDIAVELPGDDGIMRAAVDRDGERVLVWTIDHGTVTTPGPFEHAELHLGFRRRCHGLDDDAAEAALVLRRGAWLAPISTMRFDDYDRVGPTGLPLGSCWTAQPERIEVAFRNQGSQRDYAADPDAMLAGFDEYCATP
jgi:hypothetical protein